MADLSVTYLGKKLPSPIIVSSSSLSGSVDGVKKCAASGAGAVVLKSLFEEQIEAEMQQAEAAETDHPEADAYFHEMGKHLGPADYLKLIEDAKKAVSIPVFASLNCVSDTWWARYAQQLAASGADGIELNLSRMPRTAEEESAVVENRLADIVSKVNRETSLPLAVKIGPYYTALPRMAAKLKKAGASALVLFNRFYQLDIDVDKAVLVPGYQFSSPAEIHLSLRWISILSGQVECELSASTGVHDGKGIVKQLLAGAQTVQVCSALYQKGINHISVMMKEVEDWMKNHSYYRIEDFRGKLSQGSSENPEAYERLQYVRALTGIS